MCYSLCVSGSWLSLRPAGGLSLWSGLFHTDNSEGGNHVGLWGLTTVVGAVWFVPTLGLSVLKIPKIQTPDNSDYLCVCSSRWAARGRDMRYFRLHQQTENVIVQNVLERHRRQLWCRHIACGMKSPSSQSWGWVSLSLFVSVSVSNAADVSLLLCAATLKQSFKQHDGAIFVPLYF